MLRRQISARASRIRVSSPRIAVMRRSGRVLHHRRITARRPPNVRSRILPPHPARARGSSPKPLPARPFTEPVIARVCYLAFFLVLLITACFLANGR